MAVEDVRGRWIGFLDKLEARLDELLSQSAVALPQLIDLLGFDPIPFSNALTGVCTQAKDVIGRIETTWREQVEPAFENALQDDDAAEIIERERQRGDLRQSAMEEKLRRAEVAICADAAHRMLAEGRKVLASHFSCSQCKGPLPVRQQFFRAYYVACDYCRNVNTFEPGMVARNVEHFCAHALAEAAALEAWFRHHKAQEARRSHDGGDRGDLRVTLVKLYSEYVEAYLRAKIALVPEYEHTWDLDREAKINSYIQSIA